MTKIAISLAAVLLLILAIGYFAMRFLRADDTDDFEDLPAEPSRPRDRGQEWGSGGPAAEPVSRSERGGRGHGHPSAAAPGREAAQPSRGRSGRPGAGLPNGARSADGFQGDNFQGSGFPDSAFPDPSLTTASGGARPSSNRVAGSRDSGSRDSGSRARGRNSREYAANPAPRAAEPAPDDRGYGDRRFSFNPQDAEDQRSGGTSRAAAPAGARGWAATDAESTQLLGSESRADSGRSQPGRADQGRRDTGRSGGRPPASTRTARAKRGGEMSGKDWDSLSDVDYWAELASDKPLTTTAQPPGSAGGAGPDFLSAPSAPEAPAARSDRRPRAGRADAAALADGPAIRNEPAAAGDVTAVLPARRHAPAGPGATQQLPGQGSRGDRGLLADRDAVPGRDGAAGRPGPGGRRARDLPATPYGDSPYGDSRDPDGGIAALARLGGPGAGGLPPALDDDPLTSPSFPAIRDEDSRSYRSRRAEAASSDSHSSGSHSAGAHSSGAYSDDGRDGRDTRDSGARGAGGRGSGRQPGSHSSGSYPDAGPQPAAAGYPAPAAAPDPLAGYDTRPAGASPARGRRARPDDYAGGYGQPPGRADAYPDPTVPAPPPAAGYRDYSDQPTVSAGTPPGNPYGSYVSPAGNPPAPVGPAPDAYGSHAASQETQRYSQPTGRHLAPPPGPAAAAPRPAAPGHSAAGHSPAGQSPQGYPGRTQPAAGYSAPGFPAGDHLPGNGPTAGYRVPASNGGSNVVPIHAAPVPPGSEPAGGDYGRSWPAVPAPAHDPAAGRYGQPAAEGYPGRYAAGGAGGADYPPAAAYSGSQYDQSAYLPADPPGGQPDQNGYGTPDSGYGAGTYGSYPGY